MGRCDRGRASILRRPDLDRPRDGDRRRKVSGLVGLVAASLPNGSRVLAPDVEFTSTLFPFLVQAHRRVTVRTVPPARLADSIDESTDMVAFSAVQMATGEVADLEAIAAAARDHGALTLLDATQACGWLPLDGSRFDFVVAAGYKWLLSPRGTAFMAVAAPQLEQIVPLAAGWYAGDDVHTTYFGPPLRLAANARRLDTSPAWHSWIGTAAAMAVIKEIGIDAIHEHDLQLANRFRVELGLEPSNSAIVFVDAPDAAGRWERAGIRAAIRNGRLRTSWHLLQHGRRRRPDADSTRGLDHFGEPGGRPQRAPAWPGSCGGQQRSPPAELHARPSVLQTACALDRVDRLPALVAHRHNASRCQNVRDVTPRTRREKPGCRVGEHELDGLGRILLVVPITPLGPRLIQPVQETPGIGLPPSSSTRPSSFRIVARTSSNGTPGSAVPRYPTLRRTIPAGNDLALVGRNGTNPSAGVCHELVADDLDRLDDAVTEDRHGRNAEAEDDTLFLAGRRGGNDLPQHIDVTAGESRVVRERSRRSRDRARDPPDRRRDPLPRALVSSCNSGAVNRPARRRRRPRTTISSIPEPRIAAIASSVVSVGEISSDVRASMRATSTATLPFPTTTTRWSRGRM